MKLLNDSFCVERRFITTEHTYTRDQMLLDGPYEALRCARWAAANIVPTMTSAAGATGEVIPAAPACGQGPPYLPPGTLAPAVIPARGSRLEMEKQR